MDRLWCTICLGRPPGGFYTHESLKSLGLRVMCSCRDFMPLFEVADARGWCWRYGHPRHMMYIRRGMAWCEQCQGGYNVESYPEIAEGVQVDAKRHCPDWRPGDPRDRYHALACMVKPKPVGFAAYRNVN